MTTTLIREAASRRSLFWDFSRSPIWYAPIALGFRLAALVACWAASRHALTGGSSTSLAGEKTWWDQCECGYFGVKRADRG